MSTKTPDYSLYAREYALGRPGYPAELFSYLASLVDRHRLSWDCATGSGQAALELVKHFKKVVATDISTEQIRHAVPHPHIEYRVAPSEQSGLFDTSVDLITVASAIHWFDLDAFYFEARRVLRPGGVLAAWTYHVGHMEPPFDKVFRRFYEDVLSPYFAEGAKLVDDGYAKILLPGETLPSPDFVVSAAWNLAQMLAFIHSWSGTQQYMKERGEDPTALVTKKLEQLWGEPERTHLLRWPLYIRISRL